MPSTSFVPIITKAKPGFVWRSSQASWLSLALQPARKPASPVAMPRISFVRQPEAAARESRVNELPVPHQVELAPNEVFLKYSTIVAKPA